MDTQRLKDKILQLAIQGKLVEQNPEDEPASVLLEKIKKEKGKLVKEKKIRKPKKLPPIEEDEIPFELPKGWEWVRLGEVTYKIHYGYTTSAKQKDTGVKFLRITDIQDNMVNWDTVPFCVIDKSRLENFKLRENDILVARTGGTVGKTFIIKSIIGEAVFASYLIRVITFNNIYPDFIKLFMESPLYWEQLVGKSKGTGQPNINAAALGSLIISLPPLAEQKRIVEKADQLFALIDELDSNKDELLEAIKLTRNQEMLQKAIQGKLVEQNPEDEPASVLLEKIKKEKAKLVKEKKIRKPKKLPPITEDEIPFDIPESWEWVRLADITHDLTLNDGDWIVSKNMDDSGCIKLLQLGSIGYGEYIKKDFKYITEETFKKLNCREIKKGDILINRLLKNNMCVCEMPPIQGKTITTVDTCFIRPNNGIYNSRYLLYLCLSKYFQDQVFKKASTTRQRISKGNLVIIAFPLPLLQNKNA